MYAYNLFKVQNWLSIMVKEKILEREPEKPTKYDYGAGGIPFVGCVLIGTGVGMAINNIAVGSLIGTGVGFLVMAMFRVAERKKKSLIK